MIAYKGGRLSANQMLKMQHGISQSSPTALPFPFSFAVSTSRLFLSEFGNGGTIVRDYGYSVFYVLRMGW